jgi:hypothetical protein
MIWVKSPRYPHSPTLHSLFSTLSISHSPTLSSPLPQMSGSVCEVTSCARTRTPHMAQHTTPNIVQRTIHDAEQSTSHTQHDTHSTHKVQHITVQEQIPRSTHHLCPYLDKHLPPLSLPLSAPIPAPVPVLVPASHCDHYRHHCEARWTD